MTIEFILSELHFTDMIKDAVNAKIRRSKKEIRKIAETAYTGENDNFALCNRRPLTRLTVITFMLLKKYDNYKALDICDDIIFDTFRDVSLRAELYYQQTGKAGISKEDVIWFRHIINTAIFKIGTLQYQPFEMIYLDEETIGEPYMTFSAMQKKTFPQGTPVINCHIQRGADLGNETIEQSLKDAVCFFEKHFPNIHYRAFLCYSWLLYPPMLGQLGTGSKIKQFASKFTVIGFCNDTEQAMENLFANGQKSLCSNTTSLQKMAIKNIQFFGYACGIIKI
jgi:hypothetical protein